MCFMIHDILKYEKKKIDGEDGKTNPNPFQIPNNVKKILCRGWGRGGFKFVTLT